MCLFFNLLFYGQMEHPQFEPFTHLN